MLIAAAFILIFFTVYGSSCFVTCGKLFSTLFGAPYVTMMIVGAVFVLLYTLLGVVVSLLTKAPSAEIEEDFEAVPTGNVEA